MLYNYMHFMHIKACGSVVQGNHVFKDVGEREILATEICNPNDPFSVAVVKDGVHVPDCKLLATTQP